MSTRLLRFNAVAVSTAVSPGVRQVLLLQQADDRSERLADGTAAHGSLGWFGSSATAGGSAALPEPLAAPVVS